MQAIYRSILFLVIFHIINAGVYAQEKIKSDGEIPVLAWIGVPERETTVERFRELKASGININFSNYSSVEAVEKALDIAKQAGVKLMPSCPELRSEPEETVKRLMKHPALFGYHLRDEPNAEDFPGLATWIKRIQAVDMQHPCYINLFPNYANAEQLFKKDYQPRDGKDIYEEHVDVFLKEVPVPFISFDHYPVREKNGLKTLNPGWYKNLEIIAAASQKSGLPFWAFALSVAHGAYPVASVEAIRLQMYSNLAYGAQGLQYFTYWTPGINSSWDFHHAPIGLDDKRTDVYDRIQLVNRELQNLAGVFLNAELVSVAHTGKQIPAGTRRMAKLPQPVKVLETGDGEGIVSVLKKKDHRYLVIVNKDFQSPMQLTFLADERVKRVLKDGTLLPANIYTPVIAIDPGDVAIYTWDEK